MSEHEHLDLDALADALAGERDDIALAGCAECRAALEELRIADAAVSAQLQALPALTMPADVATRLDTALARENQEIHQTHPAVLQLASGGATRRRRRPAWLPAAAAAAAVVIVGGLGFVLLPDSSPGNSASTASAPGAGLPGNYRSQSGLDYGSDGALLKTTLPSLLAGTAPRFTAAQPQTEDQTGPAKSATGQSQRSVSDPALAETALRPLKEPAALAACLSGLLPPDDPSVRPLALDYARYQGQPALVVVLPADDAQHVDIFVVAATCTAADDGLLFYTRLARPT